MARIAELKQKRAETLAEVNADHKALSDATGMRMKENKEFQASETDYLEAIGAAANAITALGKHNPQLTQLKAAAHRLLAAAATAMGPGGGWIGMGTHKILDKSSNIFNKSSNIFDKAPTISY